MVERCQVLKHMRVSFFISIYLYFQTLGVVNPETAIGDAEVDRGGGEEEEESVEPMEQDRGSGTEMYGWITAIFQQYFSHYESYQDDVG